MARLTIWADGRALPVEVEAGALLSDALLHSGHRPDMPCGGRGRCRKCRVQASGALSPLSAAELDALSPAEREAGVRLACCTRILGDARVTAAGDGAGTQICTRGEARAVERLDPMFAALGAAVDIGTTTLAAQLYDRDGLLATAAAPNPQRSFGADVISRIGRSMEGDSPALANCVRQAIAGLLRTLCGQAGRRSEEIDALVLTGNTAMLHLLCGLDVSPLAAAPFQAEELFGKTLSAAELDLPCAPGARAYLPRCMSAFVGADITTALLASGICAGRETRMLTDIGTNGEIALWHQGRLSCCSTAAGPAFEGANLSQGMQGAPGAIDHAWVADGALEVHTIGEAAPVGICGSGVADVLAGLLELGRLDETGLLNDGDDAWPLAPGVAITQGDIRQVQLAKSAVRAGIETLMARAGLAPDALAELAGVCFTWEEEDGSLPTHGDAAQLRRMLLNLISNALRAAGEGGRAGMRLARRDGRAVITVWDSGAGFTPEADENTLLQRPGSLGLGLRVARRIAAAHGGTIVVQQQEGRGSRAVVSLPLRPPEKGEVLKPPAMGFDGSGGFSDVLVELSGVLPYRAFLPEDLE